MISSNFQTAEQGGNTKRIGPRVKRRIVIKLPDGRLDTMFAWYEEKQLIIEYPIGEIRLSEQSWEELFDKSIPFQKEYFQQVMESGIDYLELIVCDRSDSKQVRRRAIYLYNGLLEYKY